MTHFKHKLQKTKHLLCPEKFDLELEGQRSSSIKLKKDEEFKHFEFIIDKCDSTLRECASDEEIIKYINRLNVDLWKIEEAMDWKHRGTKFKPVFTDFVRNGFIVLKGTGYAF